MVHLLEEMEEYALTNNIPIMQKDGIEFMLDYLKKQKVKNILEIGSAIGYSAIQMALIDENVHVTTIERDQNRYNLAVENIKKAHLDKRITIIYGDALEMDIDGIYDFIFIDAAKSQYIRFFEKYSKNLKERGTILSDNLDFHGLVATEKPIESRNVRGIVRKLKKYIDYLKENPSFETTFIHTGDGIAISTKKV